MDMIKSFFRRGTVRFCRLLRSSRRIASPPRTDRAEALYSNSLRPLLRPTTRDISQSTLSQGDRKTISEAREVACCVDAVLLFLCFMRLLPIVANPPALFPHLTTMYENISSFYLII